MRWIILAICILVISCYPKQQVPKPATEYQVIYQKCATPDILKPEYKSLKDNDSRVILQNLINNYGMCLEYSKQLEEANAVCK